VNRRPLLGPGSKRAAIQSPRQLKRHARDLMRKHPHDVDYIADLLIMEEGDELVAHLDVRRFSPLYWRIYRGIGAVDKERRRTKANAARKAIA
jgi:hypothetical protein